MANYRWAIDRTIAGSAAHLALYRRRHNKRVMTDLNRGIMKFKGADTPFAVAISTILVLGGIAFLLWWAYQSAYVGI
ncbi:MAG TPA: hypothetical protein IGS17_03960 [Oscillatoriales cyanobacterium M59_W2019_021]|nr:MAG: hypothetical protein D6728_14250 [Cyanobacteria bacterium J055]HIK33627.1 hypothetical protein [Oscillatoriales cyanobacterium M4454_W2019_049]HIK50071.1 hypothetical protein [Oscillatoriales cyanobacterium M59_W2019_021]